MLRTAVVCGHTEKQLLLDYGADSSARSARSFPELSLSVFELAWSFEGIKERESLAYQFWNPVVPPGSPDLFVGDVKRLHQ